MKVSTKVSVPEIIAVRIHHDLCPYCSKLKRDPEFSKLGLGKNEASVMFVTLDMTSQATQKRSALLMGALGLEDLWPSDLSKLGTTTFVDWKTKKIVSSVRAFDAKSIRTALRKAIKSARG